VSHDAVLTATFSINDSNMRLEVLTAALLKIQVFWNITPCSFANSLLGVLDHEQDDPVTLQNIAAIYQST